MACFSAVMRFSSAWRLERRLSLPASSSLAPTTAAALASLAARCSPSSLEASARNSVLRALRSSAFWCAVSRALRRSLGDKERQRKQQGEQVSPEGFASLWRTEGAGALVCGKGGGRGGELRGTGQKGRTR